MFELGFYIVAEDWDDTQSILENNDALAITQSDGNKHVYTHSENLYGGSWSEYKVSALFLARPAAENACSALRRHTNLRAWTIGFVPQEDWSESWRDNWKPLFFPGGLCVYPSWVEPSVPGKKVVFLDPGMAFGTGTHETTSLCLDWMGSNNLAGKTLVDWGCGSGVLALAGAAVGARKVWAFDNDNLARTVAKQNVIKNGFVSIVEVSAAPLSPLSADILIANILLGPLLSLRESFLKCLRRGGRLLLAGILNSQADSLRLAYEPIRLDITARKGEWILLEGQMQ